MTIELVRTATFWLNAIPPSIGLPIVLMILEILSDYKIDFDTYTKLAFVEFVNASHGKDNTMATQSDRCIAIWL